MKKTMEGEEAPKPTPASPLIPVSIEEPPKENEQEDVRMNQIQNRGILRFNFKKDVIVEEVKKQLWLAGPMIVASMLQHSTQIIAIMFVGHLGELALSGASMALSFASVTGFSLLLGLASALDTLSGQSYGAEQYHLLGIHMQRAMIVLTVVCIPLALISFFAKDILIVLHQDHEIAAVAGEFARYMIPSLFADAILQCLERFLQTQNIVCPIMVTSGITAILHVPLCWALVYKTGLGAKGAAIADSISYWLNLILLILYVKFSSSCKDSWTGFSKEAFRHIIPFLKLAVPSAIMVCLEMWSFELIILLSGLLPNPKLETSVLSISLNTVATVWTIPFGLGTAVSTRVSNELGAGKPDMARLAVFVVFALAITEGVVVGAVMLLIRNFWGYAYSNEKEVIKYLARMMPILAAANFLDGLQNVLSGTARGCGWQEIGAYVNLGSYYIVGIPLAIVMAFVLHIGGKGLWLGMMCALAVQVLALLAVTLPTNWEKEAKKASERLDEYETADTVDSNVNGQHDQQLNNL